MPILYRYLMKTYFQGFFQVLLAFLGLFLLLDGAEGIRRYSDKLGFNWSDMFLLLGWRLPGFMVQFLPSIALLATLLVLTRLARGNEITAIRACGVTAHRLLIPFVLAGMAIALTHAFLLENLIPLTQQAALRVEDRIMQRAKPRLSDSTDLWLRDGQQILHVQRMSSWNRLLLEVSIYQFGTDYDLVGLIEAKKAEKHSDGWYLFQGVAYRFEPTLTAQEFGQKFWPIELEFQDRKDQTVPIEDLSYSNLKNLAVRLKQEGYDSTPYEVMLQRKLADPVTTLIAILLAFPFSLRIYRMGGVLRALTLGFIGGVLLFVVIDLTTALGLGGKLPPILAGWSPVLFFAGIGAFLLAHMEDEKAQPLLLGLPLTVAKNK